MTTELEPTPGGTVLHMRFAAPRSRRERALARLMAPILTRGMRVAQARLESELAVELEHLEANASGEPDVPQPRAAGWLAPDPESI